MTIVAIADGVGPDALRDAVAGHAAPGWEVHAHETDRGAVAVAGLTGAAGAAGAAGLRGLNARVGPALATAGTWMVVGAPLRDPWGVPLGPPSCEDAAAVFDHYGPAAVQLVSGPFVALDLRYGTVVRALNGIVRWHVSTRGSWVASTTAEVVAAISGHPGTTVPPGTSVSPGGTPTSWGPAPPAAPGHDSSPPPLPWAWADRSVDERVGRLGPLTHSRFDADVWCVPGAHLPFALYLPRLRALARQKDPSARYGELQRDALPRLWWRARRAGRWLCAPAFERPLLDTFAMLWAGVGPHEAARR